MIATFVSTAPNGDQLYRCTPPIAFDRSVTVINARDQIAAGNDEDALVIVKVRQWRPDYARTTLHPSSKRSIAVMISAGTQGIAEAFGYLGYTIQP